MNSQTEIYIVCPPFYKTGGTELLHQLAFVLDSSGFKATMAYLKSNNNDSSLNPAFGQYVNGYCFFDDVKNNDGIFVIPETYTSLLKKLPPSKCVVWWESVDNYKTNWMVSWHEKGFLHGINTIRKNIFSQNVSFSTLKKAKSHLFQSSYSRHYLEQHNITENVFELRDYINDLYIKEGNTLDKSKKNNIVLFNPKKGYKITKKIIRNNPSINFLPLINMTNDQVINAMESAKVYIDFGNHPGMDRLPREAAAMHCCIITNKMGSANFFDDVPISSKFKFDDYHLNYNKLYSTINYCFNDYSQADAEFDFYRSFIYKQKKQFYANAVTIFRNF